MDINWKKGGSEGMNRKKGGSVRTWTKIIEYDNEDHVGAGV